MNEKTFFLFVVKFVRLIAKHLFNRHKFSARITPDSYQKTARRYQNCFYSPFEPQQILQ